MSEVSEKQLAAPSHNPTPGHRISHEIGLNLGPNQLYRNLKVVSHPQGGLDGSVTARIQLAGPVRLASAHISQAGPPFLMRSNREKRKNASPFPRFCEPDKESR